MLVEPALGCGDCGIGFICRGKSKKEVLTVEAGTEEAIAVGDRVEISATSRLRRSAVALLIGYPCAVLFVVLIATLSLGLTQSLSACLALAGVAVYYFVLYRLRRRFSYIQKWRIVKK